MRKQLIIAFSAISVVLYAYGDTTSRHREWRTISGSTAQAVFKALDGDFVILRNVDGADMKVSLDLLCDEDWIYLISEGISISARRERVGTATADIGGQNTTLEFWITDVNSLQIVSGNRSWEIPYDDKFWEAVNYQFGVYGSDRVQWQRSSHYDTFRSRSVPIQTMVATGAAGTASFRFNDMTFPAFTRLGVSAKRMATELSANSRLSRLQRISDGLRASQEAKRLAREAVLSVDNMQADYDRFQQITWYFTTRDTKSSYSTLEHFWISPYVGRHDNGTIMLRMRLKYLHERGNYRNAEWLFFDRVTLLDERGNRVTINCDRSDRSVEDWGLEERADVRFPPEEAMLFAASQSIDVRFHGRFAKDFTMTRNQRLALQEMLIKWKELTDNQ